VAAAVEVRHAGGKAAEGQHGVGGDEEDGAQQGLEALVCLGVVVCCVYNVCGSGRGYVGCVRGSRRG